jgi:hypothetical protein
VKCRLSVALCGVALFAVYTVRADLSAPVRQAPVQRSADRNVSPAAQPQALAPTLLSQRLFGQVLFERPADAASVPAGVANDLASDADVGQAAPLPPAPDSAILALSGLLSLGAIQLGRNVRKLHLSALPEWYHDGAAQVGHSTPLDLDVGFTHAALPVCVFAQPVIPIAACFGAQWSDAARCAPQFHPTPESPRAPPTIS